MYLPPIPDSSAGKESACNAGDHGLTWVGKIHWRKDRLPTPVFLGFPCGSAGKEPACNAGDLGSVPGLGRSPGEGKGYPLQYSGLENSMDCIVYGVAKSWTRLSDFHSPISFPSHPSRLMQSLCLSFLRHTANPCWLSILHMAMYFSFTGRALSLDLHAADSQISLCRSLDAPVAQQ